MEPNKKTKLALGNWVGDIRGSHIANAFLEFKEKNKDPNLYSCHLTITLSSGSTHFEGVLDATNPIEIVFVGSNEQNGTKINFHFKFDEIKSDGKWFQGTWKLEDGAKGIASFSLGLQKAGIQGLEPSQICAQTENLGAVTLYFDEFTKIIDFLIAAFKEPPRPVIRFIDGKSDVMKYTEEFLKDKNLPGKINNCTLSAEEMVGAYKRSIIINFIKDEGARVFVQSEDQVWVSGTVESFKRHFKKFSSFGSLIVKKYGLNLNGLLFLSFIVLVPDLSLPKRLIFLGVLLSLMVTFFQIHKLIPYTTIYLSPNVKRWVFRHHWPSILSVIMGSFIFFLITQIFSFLVSGKFLNFIFFIKESFS